MDDALTPRFRSAPIGRTVTPRRRGPVRLHTAFAWTCLSCGSLNHVAGVPGASSEPEMIDIIAEQLGIPSDDILSAGTLIGPPRVECSACHNRFDAIHEWD